MDELKLRAGEKFEAFHVAAKTVTGTSKDNIHAAYDKVLDTVSKLKEALQQLWHNELVLESRLRISAWSRDAVQRIKDGAPPLSPMLLYQDLVALFKDRMWRRSMIIFACGVACGGATGVILGLKWATRPPTGPHCRALHSHSDGTVILVEDAIANGAGPGEVLIRVQAFSVAPVDRAVLRGRGAVLRALLGRQHVTVGRGFAGIVLDVGVGVSELEMGDEVWGCVSEWSGGAGTELLTLRSTRVGKRPRGMAADVAASVPWAGASLLAALAKLRLAAADCKGRRMVVGGGASGEGCLLVQVLSDWGAHVTVAAPAHASNALQELGASELINIEATNAVLGHTGLTSWDILEREAALKGPWDAVVVCSGIGSPPGLPSAGVLRASAPRRALVDLRPHALLTDRLTAPLSVLFAASFSLWRVLRWVCGQGSNTDFLEDLNTCTPGLDRICQLVDSGNLQPVLDKVYGPQDFEMALAHACSDDAVGTTVIRFP